MTNELTVTTGTIQGPGIFTGGMERFGDWQRVAKALSQSDLVPAMYRDPQKGVANCLIALDIAVRTGKGAMEVMQNLQIVEGSAGWKSPYIIEQITNSQWDIEYLYSDGGIKEMPYDYWEGPKGAKVKKSGKAKLQNRTCQLIARRGEKVLKSMTVSVEMAVSEGWYFRNGSKWPVMTDQMLAYRAAAFFNRLYPIAGLAGVPSVDEIADDPERWASATNPDPVATFNNAHNVADDADIENEGEDDTELI